ncbi:MAG: hypothetical protein OXH20_05990 [bacterium]|nr:hypothetical protein [bacterium]MDE0667465.1 hypothetical protein [bacterium]
MAGAIFLFVAVGVCVVGFLLIWLRHRDRSTFTSSVDRFDAEMSALRPPAGSGRRRRGR